MIHFSALWRFCSAAIALSATASFLVAQTELKIGLIGIDSSHAGKFAQAFNNPAASGRIAGARIVCGFKGGSPDMERSRSRVEGFSAELRDKYGVVLVDSIAEVVARSDAIMILSVDGRAHLPQAKAVFGVGKPVFIDKPLGGTLAEAIQIVRLAHDTRTPLLSCSNYRFATELGKIKAASPGRIRGAISYGPATLEPLMPDLYFYGVHPTEALYVMLGRGCESVARVSTPDTDIVTGVWSGARTGVLYGVRNGRVPNSIVVFGAKDTMSEKLENAFPALSQQILRFFQSGKEPVDLFETLEIMAFMEAADESKRRGGAPVTIAEVMTRHGGSGLLAQSER